MIFIDVELSTNEHLVIHWADLNCVFIIVFFLPSVNLIALINNNKKVWRKFYFAYFIVLSWFELKLSFKSNDWVIFNSYRTHRFHLFLQQKKKREIYTMCQFYWFGTCNKRTNIFFCTLKSRFMFLLKCRR